MWKIKNIYTSLIAGFTTLISLSAFGQPEDAFKAYHHYKEGEYEKAREYIDLAIEDKKGSENSLTWHIRGFIYKDIFTQVDSKNPDSNSRNIAIESLLKSLELDRNREHHENNVKALRYLSTSYYNDAVLVMRELNMNTIDKALEYYLLYKDVLLKIDPEMDFKTKDIEFYKALATSNRRIYEVDRENRRNYLDKAISYYEIVLEIDPENYGALYNLAVNHYNEGAYRIEKMDPEAGIPDVVRIQAVSIKNFENALPFMLKAYDLNPDREETLKGLRGIYLSLNDEEQAEKFREILQKQDDPEDEK